MGPPPGAAIERLNSMTPQQRQRALDRLPPERRAQVEERLERYNAMPPEAKERLKEQYSEFQKLPPEKQQAIRESFRELNRLEQDRKLPVRREIVRMRQMTPEDRAARLESETFRSRFSDAERHIIRDLAENVPAPEPAHEE